MASPEFTTSDLTLANLLRRQDMAVSVQPLQ